MTTALSSYSEFKNDSGSFRCTISVESVKYSVGEETLPWLLFVLTNKSNVSQYVLKWNTPLEGFRSNFLKVYCNEEEVQYEGDIERRSNPEHDSYDLILPASSVSASVYLGEAYDLSPGVYRVELNTVLMDVIKDEGEFMPHTTDKFNGQMLRCEPVVFEIFK